MKRYQSDFRNELHTRIVRKHGAVRQIIFRSTECQDVLACEVRMIRELNTYHYDNSFGCNFTRGGESTHGFHLSVEQRQRASDAAKIYWSNPDNRVKQSLVQRERRSSSQDRLKTSLGGRRSYQQNPTRREKQREATLRRYQDPVERERTRQLTKLSWEKRRAKS